MIREIGTSDIPEFLRLCYQLHDEGVTRSLKFVPRKMMMLLWRENAFKEMAWSDEKAIGLCFGWVEDVFFGPDLVANQFLFYVAPDHRGGSLAQRMMHRFEKWAWDAGAKEIWVSQATGINIERTRELFSVMGFETVGFIARKAANVGSV